MEGGLGWPTYFKVQEEPDLSMVGFGSVNRLCIEVQNQLPCGNENVSK